MTQVNLLPPEIRKRQEVKKLALFVIGGGIGLLILILFFWVVQIHNLGGLHDQVDAQNAKNAGLQGQINTLQQYPQLQQQAEAAKNTLSLVFTNEASFSGMLTDMSRVLPFNSYLTSLSIQITGGSSAATATTNPNIVGSITLSGVALDTETIAQLIEHLGNVRGWVNPYVTTITKGSALGVQFNGTVDLNRQQILTKRGLEGANLGGGA